MSDPNQKLPINDEFSVQEILDSIRLLLFHIRKNFLPILICIIIGSGVVLGYFKMKKPSYTAQLSCMLSDDMAGQMSGLSGVLGQLGLAVPSGRYNIDKLLEICRSRKIIEKVLFERIEIGEQEDFIANHFIKIYNLNQKWSAAQGEMNDFLFTRAESKQFSALENQALLHLYHLIAGTENTRQDAMLQLDYGKTDYLMNYRMSSLSPELSYHFVNLLFDKLLEYYVQASTEKQQATYDHILAKRDSIQNQLNLKESLSASNQDRSAGIVGNLLTREQSVLNTQIFILKSALAKAEENLIIAEFALKNNTPLIQLIDRPLMPLNPDRISPKKLLIYMAIVSALLYFLFHILKRLVKASAY